MPVNVLQSSVDVRAAAIGHLVIVAGGKGTRLSAATGQIPKALVPVGGKPVLQHQLELAAASGITSVTIFAGYLGEHVVDFVGDGARFGLDARVELEDEPVGNAGALLRALDTLPKSFFLLYGDVMAAVDLRRMARRHLERGADVTALAHPNDHPYDSDLLDVDSDDWVRQVHASPHSPDRVFANLVNAALYAVQRDALRPWAKRLGKSDFAQDIMPALVTSGGRVLAYRSVEYIKDMGTPDRLGRVEADWAAGKIDLVDPARPLPTIFLDRDGTLNMEKGFLRRPEDMELISGVAAALRKLRHAGYRLVVLSNQPVIARGEASEEDIAAIHRRLEWELGKQHAYLDAIYYCPHHPDSGFVGERAELKIACGCRKPAIGLFRKACEDIGVDVARSWMVGDQTRDIEMARRAGLRSVLVRTGIAGHDGVFDVVPDFVAEDLTTAAVLIAQKAATST